MRTSGDEDYLADKGRDLPFGIEIYEPRNRPHGDGKLDEFTSRRDVRGKCR